MAGLIVCVLIRAFHRDLISNNWSRRTRIFEDTKTVVESRRPDDPVINTQVKVLSSRSTSIG